MIENLVIFHLLFALVFVLRPKWFDFWWFFRDGVSLDIFDWEDVEGMEP